MPSSTGRAGLPAHPEPGAPEQQPPGPAQPPPVSQAPPAPPALSQAPPVPPALSQAPQAGPASRLDRGPAANWPATAALACAILGGALITIPAGLLLALLGFRHARQGARGRGRCALAVALTLAWAGVAGHLVPQLIRAADPGCVAYKNTALTAYNRMAEDVSDGASRERLAGDLAAAITRIDEAATDRRSPPARRSLATLSGELRIMRTDLRAGRVVPRPLLLSLNRESGAADAACGTVHL